MKTVFKKSLLVFLMIFFTSFYTFAEYEGITDEERTRIENSQSAIARINSEKKKVQATIENIK